MNQAMSRQLRKRPLLLLVPLLLASDTLGGVTHEQPVTVLLGVATRFELQLPLNAEAGTTITATVTAYDSIGNVATGFAGPILFWSTDGAAILPQSAMLTTADAGTKPFNLVFKTAGLHTLKVKDANVPAIIQESIRTIEVIPGEAKFFQISTSTNPATAGQPLNITLTPRDTFGNLAPIDPDELVRFSSSDPKATLPPEGPFDMGTFPVTFRTAGQQSIMASAVNKPIGGRLDNLTVLAGPFHEVLLSTPQLQPADACTPAVVHLRAADFFGNTVQNERGVTLCGSPGQALESTGTTLGEAKSESTGCITGKLTGEGQVSWSNKEPASVAFNVVQPLPPRTSSVTLAWRPAGFSPRNSSLSFPNTSESPPKLRTFTGELRLLFELRNACNVPMDPPPGRVLSFVAQSPLFLSTPPEREEEGRWGVSVRLPKCPDSDAPLKIGPALDNEQLRLPNGELLQAELLRNCLPPDVQLALRSKPEGAKASPGAEVEFEVELSNTGTELIPGGLLWLETEALTGLEAKLDGERLGAFSTKLNLPELSPGEKRTLRLLGLAAVQPDPPVKLTAWYTTVDGAALTEQRVLSLEWELGVDVGCGCQTGSLPSQFLPWLALLAAASRSRSRLRRLTRGERIDR